MDTASEQPATAAITSAPPAQLEPELLPSAPSTKRRGGPGRPFVPGDKRINAGGRPRKGTSLKDILEQKMDKQRLADALLEGAYRGDPTLIRYVFDRVLGTPVQRTEDITPERKREWAAPIARALGTTVEDVLAQYEQLRQLHPGT